MLIFVFFMLYDRPYMRQSQEPESKQASIVTTLLIVTISIFVLQQLLNVMFPNPHVYGNENLLMHDWLALSGQHFRELKVWTVISYCFLHSTYSLLHIVGNMLGLYFIGRMLEPILGRNKFLLLYFGGALIGGLVYLALHFNGSTPVVGASAAVFALLSLFCLLYPERPITLLLFFILPVTVKPKFVYWGSIGISLFFLLFYELPGKSHMAHSAHLGGILTGFLFYRYVYKSDSIFGSIASSTSIEQPAWFKRRKQQGKQVHYTVNRSTSDKDNLQNEVDRILDKINASGFGSLSEEEKLTLERAKDLLGK